MNNPITFEEWWTAEFTEPPHTPAARTLFDAAHRAWRNALARGQIQQPAQEVMVILERVAQGMTTAEDALTLREHMTVQALTNENLEIQLQAIEQQAQAYAQAEQQAEAERKGRGIPPGAHMMGGTRWRCPRCSFIAGNVRHEPSCRACNYPEPDTRDWYNEDGTEKDVVPE